MEHCAVCGEPIDPYNPPFSVHHNGEEYGFCSAECKEEFEQDPDAYAEPSLT